MSGDETARAVITVRREDLSAARATAAEHEVAVTEIPASGIDPISAVALVLIGSSLAVSLVQRAIDARQGGQVIDLRPEAGKHFYRTRDVVYGLVVVIGTDGSVTVEVREPDGNFREVIETVAKLTMSLGEVGIEAIAKVLRVNLPAEARNAVTVIAEHPAEPAPEPAGGSDE